MNTLNQNDYRGNRNNRSYNQPSNKSGSILQEICGRRFYAFGHIRRCSLIIDRLLSYNKTSFLETKLQYFSEAEIERLTIIKNELDNLFQRRQTRYLTIKEYYGSKDIRHTKNNSE